MNRLPDVAGFRWRMPLAALFALLATAACSAAPGMLDRPQSFVLLAESAVTPTSQALATAPSGTDAQPTDAELAESWARVYLHANPGPFQYVAYEVTSRGPAGVVSHLRGNMGRRDAIARTELLPKAKLRALFGHLRALGGLDLPHPPVPGAVPPVVAKAPKGRKGKAKIGVIAVTADDPLAGPARSTVPIFELSFRLGGRENSLLVADPFVMEDRRYAAFVQAVRELVIASVGDIGYPGPTGAEGQEGRLFIDSVPSAKVWVDGEALAEETPILSYTVAPGSHTIVLENPRLGLKREYKVKVQSGLTTSLEVELR